MVLLWIDIARISVTLFAQPKSLKSEWRTDLFEFDFDSIESKTLTSLECEDLKRSSSYQVFDSC